MNGAFIYSPVSPADIMSAMGQNMCLDEGADPDPAKEKKTVNQWALINCDHKESIKGLFNIL